MKTCINEIRLISHVEVVNHRRLIQVRKLRHIIRLVKLRRIDLVNAFYVDLPLLLYHQHLDSVINSPLPTLPSSHWTSNCPLSSSCTTQPRTKAAVTSLNQTYRLPEKSFSPSMPSTFSGTFLSSSDLINCGAKVPVAAILFRFEFDLARVELLLAGAGAASGGASDPCRAWLVLRVGVSGDERTVDFGLPLLG